MNKQEKYYDAEKKKAVNNHYIFRLIAVAYLIYLVYSLVQTMISGESEMEMWLQILLTAALAVATIVIAFFSIRGYIRELKDAEITKEEYYAHIDAMEKESASENPDNTEKEGEADNADNSSASSDSDKTDCTEAYSFEVDGTEDEQDDTAD